MAIDVHVDWSRRFAVRAGASDVFRLLSDVPRSAAHFPRVASLTALGPDTYQWQMQRVGTPQLGIQTTYACKYTSDALRRHIEWTPVEGIGNARLSGRWTIADLDGASTRVELAIAGRLSVPLSGLLKGVVAPMVEAEFKSLLDQYIANLTRQWGGPA